VAVAILDSSSPSVCRRRFPSGFVAWILPRAAES